MGHSTLPQPLPLPAAATPAADSWPGSVLLARTEQTVRGLRGMGNRLSAWRPVRGGGPPKPTRGVALQPADLPALYKARFNAGDLDGLLELYHGDAVLVTNEAGDAVSGEQLRSALAVVGSPGVAIKITSRVMAQNGHVALVTSKWAITGLDTPLSGVSTDVCLPGPGGNWLFHLDIPPGLAMLLATVYPPDP